MERNAKQSLLGIDQKEGKFVQHRSKSIAGHEHDRTYEKLMKQNQVLKNSKKSMLRKTEIVKSNFESKLAYKD